MKLPATQKLHEIFKSVPGFYEVFTLVILVVSLYCSDQTEGNEDIINIFLEN